jgi:exosortase A-associated hydrolase 1
MSAAEVALTLPCRGQRLLGVWHPSSRPARRGVIVVVGGPQYRAGAHRQFVLLARHLAQAGIPVLRFDCRGMGDSDGEFEGFAAIGPDIAAAVDEFSARETDATDIVLWGLCDGASAILDYAHRDPRIKGLVLLNPWVRTEEGLARARVRHYYPGRALSVDFWRKLFSGGVDIGGALSAMLGNFRRASGTSEGLLTTRMARGLERFEGRVLVVTSGKDLVAKEFLDTIRRSPEWRRLVADPRVSHHDIADADHTFSTAAWRGEVAAVTAEWMNSW